MNFEAVRNAMVESQIRTNKVTDEALIRAFRTIPRELFLPNDRRALAYQDNDVDIGNGRYLTEPMITARLIQSLDLKPNDMVMVIGGGAGYTPAIVSRVAGTIVALDSDRQLLSVATEHFRNLGIETIITAEGDLLQGCDRYAPYDAILVDGGCEFIADKWLEQLAEGGRLIALVNDGSVGHVQLIEKKNGHFAHKNLFEAWAPVLPGIAKKPSFSFV